MDPFFNQLGRTVLERWKRANFSLEKFPAIAQKALDENPPAKRVKLPALMREFLLNDEQPLQGQSGFGQPEIMAYEHPRFYIQLLFWMDGTTDIHQHEFSGAFHVMHGSSIHAHYAFDNAVPVTPHLRVGDVRMQKIELLETGRTVPIISGSRCIHSLFHLDTPSVTVVVRTQHDPGTGPQFNYLPPHIAMDPMHSDTLTMRRKQLLDVLEQTGAPDYDQIVLGMIRDLDFERGFFILQNCMAHLHDLDCWDTVLKTFVKKHGSLARGVAETLREGVRRDVIKSLRGPVSEPEHRFFLALLMNVTTRQDLLKLVKQRFPEMPPVETVLRWLEELAIQADDEVSILDAYFPDDVALEVDEQAPILLETLRFLMTGGKKCPATLQHLTKRDLAAIATTLEGSSLRPLVV